ncbi:ATP-binding protein [Streptomyces enissocaesilis]|uniref:ATP-binding protein n=1 Tax=Streptomyces enissocaesilis TaxID=332589 RepID=A0ABN3WMW9_9ACTN
MKQFAAKTLGAAALGAAFAAAAVGSASAAEQAAPAAPDVATALSTVTSVLPVQETGNKLPAGTPESLAAGQNAFTGTVANTLTPKPLAAGDPNPVGKLLLGTLPGV